MSPAVTILVKVLAALVLMGVEMWFARWCSAQAAA